MNGNYYQNPTFPTNQNNMQNMTVPPGNVSSMEDYNEQSYIENILIKEEKLMLMFLFQIVQNGKIRYFLD